MPSKSQIVLLNFFEIHFISHEIFVVKNIFYLKNIHKKTVDFGIQWLPQIIKIKLKLSFYHFIIFINAANVNGDKRII